MTNVQIAIKNQAYAEKLRDLLSIDGEHSVFLADYPRPDVAGVVVADAALLDRLEQSGEIGRSVIFVSHARSDWTRLFEAGVRHVIHSDSPPEVGRLTVLAAERRLNGDGDEESAFDSSDQLFLRGLKISHL